MIVPDSNLLLYAVGLISLFHKATVHSADTDFSRFPEVRWRNPLPE